MRGMPRLPDYHIHTHLCRHAEGSPSDYLDEATKKGLLEICFCDHMPSFGGYDPKHRMEAGEFQRYLDLIEGIREVSSMPVLLGMEADYYEGCEPLVEKLTSYAGFDLILGSVHFLNGWGFDDPEQLPVWELVDLQETWERYFSLLERLVKTGLFDAVAHLDLPKKFGHRLKTPKLLSMASPVLDLMAKKGVAMEINTSGLRKPVSEVYPSFELIKMAREREIPILFGSDAHRPEEVGHAFQDALRLIKEAGYSEYALFRRREMTLVPLP